MQMLFLGGKMMKKWKKILFGVCLSCAMVFTSVTGVVMEPQTVSAAQTESMSMALGDEIKVTFGTDTKYSSDNTKVVTVDSDGKLAAVGIGKADVVMTSGNNCFTYHINVTLTGSSKYDKKIKTIAAKIVKDNMTDVQKVKAVHDYIIKNTAYDQEFWLHGDAPFTAEGLLKNKSAVCEGYAKTFQAFMYEIGIPCKMVVGYADPNLDHAWNMVKVDGKWYQIDVTWDDPLPDKKGRVSYNYFLLTDQEMAKDHVALTQGLPKCKTSADKYTSEFALICKNRSQMKKQVTKALSNKKTDVILALRKGSGIDVKDVCNEIYARDRSRRSISYSQTVKGSYTLIQLEQGK